MLKFKIIIFHIIFSFNKKKYDFKKLKDHDEIREFVLKYDIDVRRINYSQLLKVLALINSFIISIATVIIYRVDNIIFKIIVCFAVVMSLIYSLYSIAGKYFKTHELNVVSDEENVVEKKTKKKKTKKKEVEK